MDYVECQREWTSMIKPPETLKVEAINQSRSLKRCEYYSSEDTYDGESVKIYIA